VYCSQFCPSHVAATSCQLRPESSCAHKIRRFWNPRRPSPQSWRSERARPRRLTSLAAWVQGSRSRNSRNTPRLVCSVLVNSDSLTANYGIKQSQFIKSTSKPRASDPEKSNEAFDRTIREGYCSITVANHRLITVVRFVAKNYTHP